MKNIIKSTFAALMVLAVACGFSSCKDADPEFVHTDNLISQLFMMTTQQGNQFSFTIDEYDAAGNLVTGNITAEDVQGGYGIAHIEFPFSQMYDPDTNPSGIDLTSVYLTAHVGYDVIITPGLTGRHNISGEGIVITARAGSGAPRKYRVYGTFE